MLDSCSIVSCSVQVKYIYTVVLALSLSLTSPHWQSLEILLTKAELQLRPPAKTYLVVAGRLTASLISIANMKIAVALFTLMTTLAVAAPSSLKGMTRPRLLTRSGFLNISVLG